MEVSRITFMKTTLNQTGTIGKLLMWMQDNPKQTRNTNLKQMAKTYCMTHYGNADSLAHTFQRMLNNQMITRAGGKRHSQFFINYFHPQMPGYIKQRAPKEDKERIERIEAMATQQNQYVDGNGCVVTEPEKEAQEPEVDTTPEPEPESIPEPELEVQETVESNPTVEEETTNVSSDASEENTTSAPIAIRETERGLSISITLNLNINK